MRFSLYDFEFMALKAFKKIKTQHSSVWEKGHGFRLRSDTVKMLFQMYWYWPTLMYSAAPTHVSLKETIISRANSKWQPTILNSSSHFGLWPKKVNFGPLLILTLFNSWQCWSFAGDFVLGWVNKLVKCGWPACARCSSRSQTYRFVVVANSSFCLCEPLGSQLYAVAVLGSSRVWMWNRFNHWRRTNVLSLLSQVLTVNLRLKEIV